MSDDGNSALVVIAMLGNVFSPYYAAARRVRREVDPLAHSTMNVALYTRRGNAWALTERNQNAVRRTRHELLIGNSVMRWERGELLVDLDERRAPFGGNIRGSVRLTPSTTLSHHVVLDDKARHHWWPTALGARAEVRLSEPNLSFSGEAYHDVNAGDEGLEEGFRDWTWSRGRTKRGVVVTYDVTRKSGTRGSTRFVVDARGRMEPLPDLPSAPLARTKWRLQRELPSDRPELGRLVKTLEDTPFYARSLVESRVLGEDLRAVHETVSLERFASPWVQFLLPFRMGRQNP